MTTGKQRGKALNAGGEAALLLAAVRRSVERSSARAVAYEVGLSHGCIYKLVTGETQQIYGPTVDKLRAWYLSQWAAGRDSLTPEVAAYLLEQVLASLPAGTRNRAALELVGALERLYDSNGTPRPVWLAPVRNGYQMGGE